MLGFILAAGVSRRLRSKRDIPKQLRTIGGIPLLAYQALVLRYSGIDSPIAVVRDEHERLVRMSLAWWPWVRLFVVGSTASGWYSFLRTTSLIRRSRFLLLMGDSVMDPCEVKRFSATFSKDHRASLLVGTVRPQRRDKTPCYVQLDSAGRVVGLGKRIASQPNTTAGIYGCSPSLLRHCAVAERSGIEHLSEFFSLVTRFEGHAGCYPISSAVDVDTAADLPAARRVIYAAREYFSEGFP